MLLPVCLLLCFAAQLNAQSPGLPLPSDQPGIIDIVSELYISGGYDEPTPRPRNIFEVSRLNDDVGLDSVQQASLFEDADGNVYLGTSMYYDYNTNSGAEPILSWDATNEVWDYFGVHPSGLRPGLDAANYVTYFNTADNALWAYDALYYIQDSRTRYTNIIGGNGSSFILGFSATDSSFSSDPAFTFFTNFSTSRSTYFKVEDNREFLWTFSWGPGSAPVQNPAHARGAINDNRAGAGSPICALIEYTGGNWDLEDNDFIGCVESPRSPVVFVNVEGNWIYLFPGSDGSATFFEYNTNNQSWTSVNLMDDLTLVPAGSGGQLDTVFWWVDDDGTQSYDMLVAFATTGVYTIRLHWDQHHAEMIPTAPTVPAGQGAPYSFAWYSNQDTNPCFIVGGNNYPGLASIPSDVYNWYHAIWCWDQSHDVWNSALNFPSKASWFLGVFAEGDDDTQYITSIQKSHLTTSALTTYRVTDRSSDTVTFAVYPTPGTYTSEAQAFQNLGSQVNTTENLAIAILAFVVFIFLIFLVLAFMMSQGKGGGGSDDYTAFH